MIVSFLHKGLKQFYLYGSQSGIQSEHINRLRLILTNLDQATKPSDMDLPGLGLHKLKGTKSTFYSVKVNKNWRLTFRFIEHDVELVNYEDYH